jgi:hypothetical protein
MHSTSDNIEQILDVESRWPVALAIIAVVILQISLPDRIRLGPVWVAYIAGGLMLLPMVGVMLARAKTRWLRLERRMILLVVTVVMIQLVVTLGYVIDEVLYHSRQVNGLQLFTSSVGLWVANILTFSLIYWQTDRGGPESRLRNSPMPSDWEFPSQRRHGQELPDWRPGYVDYLFIAYTTATAFSPADVMPLSQRAKLMMILESAFSLVNMVVVASRAIGILGS